MQIGDPEWKWRTASTTTRVVAVLCFVSWFAGLSSMMLAGYADHQALANSDAPTGLFVHAYEVKGVVRFVTDDLAELGRFSKRAMLVSSRPLPSPGASSIGYRFEKSGAEPFVVSSVGVIEASRAVRITSGW
jgi:hypothetical protein